MNILRKNKYHRGELYLDAMEILHNLWIEPTSYAPILRVKPDGRYRYDHVNQYNLNWLHKTKTQQLKQPDEYEQFIPSKVWIEDRWFSSDAWLVMSFVKNVL